MPIRRKQLLTLLAQPCQRARRFSRKLALHIAALRFTRRHRALGRRRSITYGTGR
jgi:hypothetical protein